MFFNADVALGVFVFGVGFILAAYVIFEEDSISDVTDFHAAAVFYLVLAALSLATDNSFRAALGAWLETDRAVFLYALFKSLVTVLYFGVI